MANTVGRLKQGDFLIEGEVLERTTPIKSGLVMNFPFDNTEIGINYTANLLDDSTWVPGLTGTVGMFGANGTAAENQIITRANPWGEPSPVWATLGNDATSNDDGGWNVGGRPVDATKKYRLTVWIRRENVGDGRIYFGCQASTVANLSDGVTNSNPYFISPLISEAPEMQDDWVLFVAYIHPSTYVGSNDPTNGIYKLNGIRTRGMTDYKWVSGQTTGGHRTYLYYSTSTAERCYWYRPRMEICDGTEPTIKELIMGMNNAMHPTLNANTTLSPDGIYIEESTTNSYTGPVTQSVYFTSAYDGEYGFGANTNSQQVIDNSDQPFAGVDVQKVTRINSGVNQRLYLEWSELIRNSGTVTFAANEERTVSFYYYGTYGTQLLLYFGGHTGNLALYADNAISGNGTTNITIPVKPNEWNRVVFRVKNSDATASTFNWGWMRLHADNEVVTLPNYHYWKFTAIQVEKKAWATAYTNSSRSANGDVQISCDPGPNFTLFYRFTPDKDWGDYYTVGYNRYMFYLYDKNTTKKIWLSDYHATGAMTVSDPWIGYDEFVSTGIVHWHNINVDMQANRECWFALSKSGSTWTKYLYSANGLTTDTITQSDGALALFSPNKIQFSSNFNQKVRDVSLYNRALSKDEITKLGQGSFSLTKDGNIKAIINEQPNSIPNGTVRFPLDADGGSDEGKAIVPTIEANTVYKDGAVWIGRGTSNMISSQNSFTAQFSTSTYDSIRKEWTVTVVSGSTAAWRGISYNSNNAIATPGTTHTFSFEVYADAIYPISVDINNFGATTSTGTNDNDTVASRIMRLGNTQPGRWISMSVTYTFASSLTQNFYMQNLICLGNGYVPSGDAIFKVRNIQQEQAPFPSPFVNGTRDRTRLIYNQAMLNVNAGAIMGWWKFDEAARTYRGIGNDNDYSMLFATYGTGEINKINIRSYYSNAANYWLADVTNSSGAASTIAFYPSNGWHFVALCWDKTNLKLKLNLDGKLVSEVTSANLPSSFDSPLYMGLWNDGVWGAMNQYMRDLMIMSVYPTDTQLSTIYNTQLRTYKNNNIVIQGQIKEGVVL